MAEEKKQSVLDDEKDTSSSSVNVYLQQPEEQKEEIIISLHTIVQKFSKWFLPWVLASIIIAILIAGVSIFFSTTSSAPVQALIGFNYNGIEKGKNPDGTDFNPYSIKSPQVISKALQSIGMEADDDDDNDNNLLEKVREGIEIVGDIPEDAYDRLTLYKSVYETAGNGQLSAVEKMLETSWNATQFRVKFDYKKVGITRTEAVKILNAILVEYRSYFFEKYGYNEALGESLDAMSYTEYDYAQAVDQFESTLKRMKRYVNNLASDDTARFRSTDTGYTFADLREAISLVQDSDLSRVTSYINANIVTKDKDRLRVYYDYRIENLTLEKSSLQSQLGATEQAIKEYEKDNVYIFGGTDDVNLQTTMSSTQYDNMMQRKLNLSEEIAETTRSIEYYRARQEALKKNTVGSSDKKKVVEQDLEAVNEKISRLIELVNLTANDYYENVSLANAYKIKVPASMEVKTTVVGGIKNALLPLIGVEMLLFAAYITVAFVQTLKHDYLKHNAKKIAAKENAGKAE